MIRFSDAGHASSDPVGGRHRARALVTGVATVVCLVLALATALMCAVKALRDRAVTRFDLAAAAVTEVAILIYVLLRVIDLVGGHHSSGLAVVIAYLGCLALTMPVTAALAWAEPTKWGSVVLASGALVACVLFARIDQLWTVHG